jgi:FkbM family methyltransferase
VDSVRHRYLSGGRDVFRTWLKGRVSKSIDPVIPARQLPTALPFTEQDLFRGFTAEDVDRISSLRADHHQTAPDLFVDALGIKVDPSYCPWISGRVGCHETEAPLPWDGYLGDGIEYAALALAFEWALPRDIFTVGEIGAGWGHWVSASALTARRRGFRRVNLIAFEADSERYGAMRQHLAINDLVPPDALAVGSREIFSWKLHNAAAHWSDTTLYWPAAGKEFDAGMAAVDSPDQPVDYRGVVTAYKPIPALDIRDSFDDIDVVDLLHIDIQGSEYDLISNILDFLSTKVRCLFVGTHSRKIEGDLIHDLRQRGWVLIREKPCQFYSMAGAPTLIGLTYLDGGQFWRTSCAL